MSTKPTEQILTENVQRSFDTSPDERFRQLFVCLVQHLHDFAREVRLTGEEWITAMDFLERVGKFSTPTRQEFVLLADLLGLSTVLDDMSQPSRASVTGSAMLGPFYVDGRPTAANGSDISGAVAGTPMFVTGEVVNEHGERVAGAHVDTWHCDSEGFYDIQQAEQLHDQHAMRALLTTDDNGRFWYRSITPHSYPAPTDGPCGEILRAANRSPMRPQHVHFRIHADGYQPLITQLFRRDDPYIDCDAAFAVKDSLKADFVQHDRGIAPDRKAVKESFVTLDWTFVLAANDDREEDGH
jgi:hydroxyquinol 1,2-dioxygenase